MEQFKQHIKTISNKDLVQKHLELSKYAAKIGKTIPTLTDLTTQQTYLTEYTKTMEKLNIIKAEMNHRGVSEKVSFFDKIKAIFKKNKTEQPIIQQPIEQPIQEQPKVETKLVEQPIVNTQPIKPTVYEEETDILRSTDMLDFLNPEKYENSDFKDVNELESTSSHKNDNRDVISEDLNSITL